MTARKRPPRPWDIDDLQDIGKKGGITFLKAIPVLILEKWVREGREEKVANYVRTKELARRLESSGLVSFKPRGTSNVIAALTRIQRFRNLTRPPLVEYQGQGSCWINLPYYEPLLQEYCQKYREEHQEDYRKLFPAGEPRWECPSLPKIQTERKESRPIPGKSAVSLRASRILPVEEDIDSLRKDSNALAAKLDALAERVRSSRAKEARQLSFVHTSPDFHNSAYGAKVTSIRDTIEDMLKRAEQSIRISTRQIDMFEDDLIRLKQDNPDLEIVVLSRGPERVEGPRKHIAGRAFERMKTAGVKLPVEQDILHSRMIVIDAQEVLVSSADLDYTQMEKEFNAGIWTNNPDVVAEAISYFDNLLRSPTIKGPR
jgi:sugar-specific transcriptional regulator TrmB